MLDEKHWADSSQVDSVSKFGVDCKTISVSGKSRNECYGSSRTRMGSSSSGLIFAILLLLLVGVLHLGAPLVVFVGLVRTPAATFATPVFLNAIVARASMRLALFGSRIVESYGRTCHE